MPKKGKRVRGQAMNLSTFLGAQASQDNLPSAPSGNSDSGDRGGYRGGRGGREDWKRGGRDSGYPPSRAEESNSWRRVGANSGGSGWGSGGGGGYQPRGNSGLSTSNRFDSSSYDSGPGWRRGGGTQDARGDTRPAHLRNRFGRNDRMSEFEAQEKARKASKEEYDRKQAESKAKVEARAAEDRKEKHKAREASYASNLRGKAVRWANKKSPLEIAVEDSIGIKQDQLEESFRRLNFKKSPVDESARILSNGLIDARFSCDEFIQSLQGNCSSQAKISKLAVATFHTLHARGPERYHRVVDTVESKVLLDIVNPSDLEGGALDKFLEDNEIFFLKPTADISEEVHSELKNGCSADAVLSLIESKIDEKQFPTNLIPIVMAHVLRGVYESKTGLALDVIQSFAPVLIRCQEGLPSRTAILFAVQRAWCRDGQVGARIREVFQKLHELEVVGFEALGLWRDDRTATNDEGKSEALFAVAGWITEITPIPEREETDEEEEDEEGDGDADDQ